MPPSLLVPAACAALAAAVVGEAQPPLVSEVRFHAPALEHARYARYIALRPGQPLDPEVVAESVRLLYATGSFSDVIVEKSQGPDGVLVDFRTVPTPRLQHVRVASGSPRTAAWLNKVTGLRRREPLWPSRLERAGRDAGLALAKEGYLEARVTVRPVAADGGADAWFEVAAGPRVRVRSVRIEGVGAAEARRLQRRLGLRAGDAFDRSRMERASESLRRELAEQGRWSAAVRPQEAYDPRVAAVDLVVRVDAGPPTRVELRGAPDAHSLRGDISNLLRDGALGRDALEAGLELIESHYRDRGHRDVEASYRIDDSSPLRMVIYEIAPGPRSTVASVAVEGAPLPTTTALSTRLSDPVVDRRLEQDVEVLRQLLEEQGHVSAQVEVQLREGGGLTPVVFRASPGPRTTVRSFEVAAPPADLGGAVAQELRVRVGGPYRIRDLARDRELVAALYRNAGYLSARVEPQVRLSADRTEADVVLAVEPGPRISVDQIVVAGLETTRELVVRRELAVRPGEPLGLQRVLESQRRLAGLGILSRVDISEVETGDPTRRHLRVAADEAPRHTLAYGLGYSEREKLRASIEITRNNLSGLNRSLSLFARGSFKGSRFFTTYRVPYFFGRRRELYVTGFWEEDDREGFDYNRYGGLMQTPIGLTDTLRLILRLSYQDTNTFNVEVPCQEEDRRLCDATVSGPSATIIEDSRDDQLSPTRGHFLGADLQLSHESLGGDSFAKGFLQGACYTRTLPRLILALNGRVGLSRALGPYPSRRLPLPERFFLGGDFGLRGFETDTVNPEGGNGLLFGGAELRFDAGRSVSIAAFGEAGNIYPLVEDMSLGDLRYTAGLGLRYTSAFGPLRVDWGYKLNRREGEPASRWHFTIGHAF
jgi:outer membrane protein insertion porin family